MKTLPGDGIRKVYVVAEKRWVPVEQAPPRHRGQFIPPIPAEWFKAARGLPGEALAVGLIIRMEAAKRHSRHVDRFTGRMTEAFGIRHMARLRALAALETAGLIQVERRPRCSPKITIIERD